MDMDIFDLESRIKEKINNLHRNIKDFDALFHELEGKVIEKRKLLNNCVPYMIRKIMQYISEGDTELVAIGLVAEEFCYPLYKVHSIWDSAKCQKKALNMYARAYTAQRMAAAGYSSKDIAVVLKLSETSVRKLLKSRCVCI